MALVLSTLGVVGSAPAYGHTATAKSAAVFKEEHRDQQEIAKFDGDIARLKQDFGLLPPEINSMLTHAGPGSAPLLAAATAWDGLANELQDAASSYASVTSELTSGSWLGPAATSTAAAAAPYVDWMQTTARQAEQAAAQASAAATAYEQGLKSETTSVPG